MNTTVTINDIDKRVKLTALWIYVFLNMIFRDLHQFGNAEFVDGMIAGVINGVQVTDGLMLVGGIMIAVPLLMIPLIQFLNYRANRLANVVVGAVQIVMTIGVNLSPDLDDIFFAVIELAALMLIVLLAWNWQAHQASQMQDTNHAIAHPPV